MKWLYETREGLRDAKIFAMLSKLCWVFEVIYLITVKKEVVGRSKKVLGRLRFVFSLQLFKTNEIRALFSGDSFCLIFPTRTNLFQTYRIFGIYNLVAKHS